MALRHIPSSYKEAEELLKDKDERIIANNTKLIREEFEIDGHKFDSFAVKHFYTKFVIFYPDDSIKICTKYKTKTTIDRLNRALISSDWLVYREKGEIVLAYCTSSRIMHVYTANDGDRVYLNNNGLTVPGAIYEDIYETGYALMMSVILLNE